jgi:hypothetical protein
VPGWLAQPLRGPGESPGRVGIIHQLLWRRSRSVSYANRSSAARSDEKPLPAESSSPDWFRVRANRSYPEGTWLLLCTSTDRDALAVVPERGPRRRKTPKGGTTRALGTGGTRGLGRTRKTLRNAGDRLTADRWLASERQPES